MEEICGRNIRQVQHPCLPYLRCSCFSLLQLADNVPSFYSGYIVTIVYIHNSYYIHKVHKVPLPFYTHIVRVMWYNKFRSMFQIFLIIVEDELFFMIWPFQWTFFIWSLMGPRNTMFTFCMLTSYCMEFHRSKNYNVYRFACRIVSSCNFFHEIYLFISLICKELYGQRIMFREFLFCSTSIETCILLW